MNKKFVSIYYENCNYDLQHLNPFYCSFVQENNNHCNKKIYKCLVEFSDHCFTKKQNDLKKTRIFCPIRYELSKKLPEIIRNIDKQKVFFTSAHDKFVRIQNLEDSSEYEIYFSLKKSNNKNYDVYLFINSAYIRDLYKKRPRRKPISFFILLYNTITKKKIKNPS